MNSTNSPADRLRTELDTYEKNKDALLAQGEGKFALIQGTTIHGVWGTYEDALNVGYQQFGIETPFLVKQISRIEQVQIFSFTLPIIETNFASQGIDGLIGRDILSQCVLGYNGPHGHIFIAV